MKKMHQERMAFWDFPDKLGVDEKYALLSAILGGETVSILCVFVLLLWAPLVLITGCHSLSDKFRMAECYSFLGWKEF